MKTLFAFISAILLTFVAMTPVHTNISTDKEDHVLSSLWDTYRKAADSDRPKDQQAALEKIKEEALSRHLVWDYYDACEKYAEVRTSTNWKLREEAQNQFRTEIEEMGEPVAVFYLRRSGYSAEQMLDYVSANRTALEKGCHTEFQKRDTRFNSFKYSEVLRELVKNDYDYALWALLGSSSSSTKVQDAIKQRYGSEYPYAAFLKFTSIGTLRDRAERKAKYESAAKEYEGKAAALLFREESLELEFNELNNAQGSSSKQYVQLKEKCEKFISDAKRFNDKGSVEWMIAKECTGPENLLEILNSTSVDVAVENDVATVTVRNLPSVRLKVTKDKKEVFDKTVKNTKNSFYVLDEMKVDLPAGLDDGVYDVSAENGKTNWIGEWEKYTLSIAHKVDASGYSAFVADFATGEPVPWCELSLFNDDDKQVASERMAVDGFSKIPDIIAAKIDSSKRSFTIQAKYTGADKRVRLSKKHSLSAVHYQTRIDDSNPQTEHCVLLTDRKAFNPDETVHFKAILYTGRYSYKVREAGVKVTATLFDPQGKEIDRLEDLSTNEFGSVDGSFILKKSERGGGYEIKISSGDRTLASTQLTVDEFVLPSFTLSWAPEKRWYFPGDQVSVKGNVKSYSGHSLGTAKVKYDIRKDGDGWREGNVILGQGGDFTITFDTDKESEYYTSYAVRVTVIDSTGETLEFSKNIYVGDNLPMRVRVTNAGKGSIRLADNSSAEMIEDELKVDFGLSGASADGSSYPGVKISYELTDRSGKTAASGTAEVNSTANISLKGFVSGLYKLSWHAEAVSENGKRHEDEGEIDIFKASDSDTILNEEVQSFFREVGDNEMALQIGATCGPVWAVVELYGNGNQLLEKRIEKLVGEKGKPGSLKVVRFTAKDSYPENLTMKVFYFHDAKSFSYSRSIRNEQAVYTLPLSFTRFLDTTAPAHDYSFTIKTAAGVECAATIFDKSTETIRANRWSSFRPQTRSLPQVHINSTCGHNGDHFEGLILFGRSSNRMMAKSVGVSYMANATADGVVIDEETALAPMMAEAATVDSAMEEPEQSSGYIREDFSNTIAWEPYLRSDKDGVITFNFRNADKMSTYYVQLFAHDKDVDNAVLRREMVVTMPVKIAVVQPQYLYEGDRYVARVTVASSKDTAIPGKVSVKFLDGTDYKTAPVITSKSKSLTVPAGGSADYDCEISAPAVGTLGLLVEFTADDSQYGSDGVFVTMPVSPASQEITEAHSAILRYGEDEAALEAELRKLFVNIDGADAKARVISILDMLHEAIPEKVLPKSDNIIDQTEALYANYLLTILPGVTEKGASEEEKAKMVEKVVSCWNSGNGGFGWFPEMTSSPIVTAMVLERCAKMGDDTPSEIAELLPAAAGYLDQSFFNDSKRPVWCGGLSLEQYLYVRSFYPEVKLDVKVDKDMRKAVKEYLVPKKVRGLNGQILPKARRLKTLKALAEIEGGKGLARSLGVKFGTARKISKSVDADIESLSQYAQPHKCGGMYYPNAVMPWRGLMESELYAHSLLCDLMDEGGHDDIAEGIRLWFMVQKETQQWDSDPAYIEAIGSTLRGSEETLQTKVVALSGSVVKPFQTIKAAGNGFSVKRTFWLNGNAQLSDGDILHIGDKVTARYEIWNEENRSFVKLTVPRPAALRPVDQISGHYGWWLRPIAVDSWYSFSPQGYRSVLAEQTEYWFDSYPEEKTTISEDFFVTQEGSFQSPVPTIESLYAPHYRANDDGHPAMTVIPAK